MPARSLRLVLFLTFASALLLAMVQTANACSCAPRPTVLQEFEGSDEVVILRVISVEKAQDETDYGYIGGIRSTTLRVEKVFKGNLKVGDEIAVGQGNGANCVYSFGEQAIGHQFLLYLDRPENFSPAYMSDNDKDLWIVSTCGRSTTPDEATEDLLYLEKLNKVRGKTRISGMIRGWHGSDLDVGGKKIRIVGPKKTYVAKTDAKGVFEIYDLPPGKYFVEPETPSGWRLDYYWLTRSMSVVLNDSDEREPRSANRVPILLEPKKHARLDIAFVADNFVRGRVLGPKAQPMSNVCVYLLPPGKTDWSGSFDCTDRQGRFEITSVPEGEYVLVANQTDKLSNSKPFHRVFYPNVSERERAAVLVIRRGDVVENIDLVIPALEEMITVKGVLLYSDGNPVVERSVRFRVTGAVDNVDGDVSERTDGEGQFILKILKGLTGELAAEEWLSKDIYKNCPKVDELIAKSGRNDVAVQTNVIKLTTDKDLYDLELTLPFPRCEKTKRDMGPTIYR